MNEKSEKNPSRLVDRKREGNAGETTAAPGILVVDDDAAVRDLLGAALTRYGFRVWLAGGGAEAVCLFPGLRGQVALALLDVRMPGLDGPAILRELRRLDSGLRCCFLTGDPGDYDEEGLLAQGAERVLRKPFRLPELAATLRTLLGCG
jgi:CheY-like chemotaxis protein